ncbi:mannose-1-phosphate guanylyltransferase [Qipengyuania sp. RANM35]|uniref:mannose-1-phosphate guanylyltransferase n=1 Tax=Qipengyuania sp. RANM35 TaxID=3068635 RepID=UPI0034DB7779
MAKIVPVILCGGSGTRLWPRSRAHRPKPFIPLLGEQTLYEQALSRCSDRTVFAAPVIVVGADHMPFATEQAAKIAPDTRFIVEPMGRNTAPAIALAAHAIKPDDVMLVCPSDHHIEDTEAFIASAIAAAELASDDWLVSFGIEASAPETGYGYIRRGEQVGGGFAVHSFVEKPDLERAKAFLSDGGYAWNGGIFAFRAGKFLSELERHRPALAAAVADAIANARVEGGNIYPDPDLFASIEGDSVDYAVMENTDRAAMVEASMGWSDIGNWDALAARRIADDAGNVVVGDGEIVDGTGSMIDTDGPYVAVIGLDDVVVVVDRDSILVTSRSKVQRVGEIGKKKSN